MKTENCQRIVAAFERLTSQMKMPLPLALKKIAKAADRNMRYWTKHRNLKSLEASLIKMPDPTEKELASIEAFFELAPWLVRAIVQSEFPGDPGGRLWDLTQAQAIEARSRIMKLLSSMPLDRAIEDVAEQYQVDKKTMMKIYDRATDTKEFQKGEIKRNIRTMIAEKKAGSSPNEHPIAARKFFGDQNKSNSRYH